MLVKNVRICGKRKIADLWEHKPYVVISQPNPHIPVYEVKNTSPRVKKEKAASPDSFATLLGFAIYRVNR